MARLNQDQEALASVEKYTRAWYDMMVKIWKDRIDLLGVIRTGALRASIGHTALGINHYDIHAEFQYLQYGLYVDRGVGNGYRPGEGLAEYIDKDYRRSHKHYKTHRDRRPWFTISWYVSREVLKNKLSDIMGEEFIGAVSQIGTKS